MTVVDEDGKKFPIDISKYEYVDEKVGEIVDDLTVYAYSPSHAGRRETAGDLPADAGVHELLEEAQHSAGKGFP